MTKDNFIEDCGNAASNFLVDPDTAHIQLKALEPVFEEHFKGDQECVDAMVKVWKAEAAYVQDCFQQAVAALKEKCNEQKENKTKHL